MKRSPSLFKTTMAASSALALMLSGSFGNESLAAGEHSKEAVLKETYESLKTFGSDRALWNVARLINTNAKRGFKETKDRVVMSRLLLLAGYSFLLDENIFAARNMFRLAHKMNPDNPIPTCCLANCERELVNFPAESKLVEELEKVKDKSIFVYMTLARNAARTNRRELCFDYLKKAEDLEAKGKKNPGLHIMMGRTLIFYGFGNPGFRHFEIAAQTTNNDYIRHVMLADAASMHLDQPGQEKHLLAASKIFPRDPAWRAKLANLYMVQGKEDEALKLIQEGFECKRFSGQLYTILARYYINTKQWERALDTVQRWEKLTWRSAESLTMRADIAAGQEKNAEAEDLYHQATIANPISFCAWEKLSHFYLHQKQPESAVAVMSECAQKALPALWRARYILASHMVAAHDLNNAVKQSRICLDLLPKQASDMNLLASDQAGRCHAIIGSKYYAEKKYAEAAEEARLFNQLKFNPDLPAYLKLVVVRPAKLKFHEKLDWKDAIVYAAMGDMLLETSNIDGSIAEYRKAIALQPENKDLHSYLLNVLSQKGDWGEAAKENIVLSQKIVNGIPGAIGNWTSGGKSKKE